METEEFIRKALSVSSKFAWIKRSEVSKVKDRVRMRLWLDKLSFIGLLQRREGWHLHPFQRAEEHVPIQQLSMEEFLRILEEELKKRNKIK
jgi:hypothetical protein